MKIILFLFKICLSQVPLYQLDIIRINRTVNVYKNGLTNPQFSMQNVRTQTCHQNPVFIIPETDEATKLILTNLGKFISLKIQKDQKPINFSAIITSYSGDVQFYNPDSSTDILIQPDNPIDKNLEIPIQFKCKFEDELNVWSYIQITIDANNEQNEFLFAKFCTPLKGYWHPLFILTFTAVIVVIIGSIYGQNPIIMMGQEQTEEFGLKPAIMFVFVASAALLTLYYFQQYILWILEIWFLVIGLMALTYLITEAIEWFISDDQTPKIRFPFIGQVKIVQILAFIFSIFILLFYVYYKYWWISNLIALGVTLFLFRIVEIDNFRTGTILLSLAFFYDIFWVFYSHYFFGQSVMASVATSIDLPLKFQCPAFFVEDLTPISRCSLIGLGDIILPGVILKYTKKCDKRMHNKYLFISGIIAYALGLMLCIFFLIMFNAAQPALLYLVPSILSIVSVQALRKKCFFTIWGGIFPAVKVSQGYELTSDQLQ